MNDIRDLFEKIVLSELFSEDSNNVAELPDNTTIGITIEDLYSVFETGYQCALELNQDNEEEVDQDKYFVYNLRS